MELRTVFILAAFGSALIDAVLAAVTLHSMLRSHPVTWRRLAVAVACAVGVSGLACAVKTAGALAVGVGPFGAIRVLYQGGAFTAVAMALMLMIRACRAAPASRWVLLAGATPPAGLVLLTCYMTFVEPYRLQLEHAALQLPQLAPREQLRIAVLADLQTDRVGNYEQFALSLALQEKADLIVLPGDFFQGSDAAFARQKTAWQQLMARLDAPGGVFACLGNVDPQHRAADLFAGSRVRLLQNEVVVTRVGNLRVAVGGVEWHFHSQAARATRLQLAQTLADVRVLLGHTPDVVLTLEPDERVDLVISGHTHGGQIQIPGFGPLARASWVPRAVAGGGLHRLSEQWVYVSRGVGFERGAAPPMRLFCPPEVSLLTLRGRQP